MLWNNYIYYGNRNILVQHYAMAKRAVDALGNMKLGTKFPRGRISQGDPSLVDPYIVNDDLGDCNDASEGQPFTFKGWNYGNSSKEGKAIYGTAWYYYGAIRLARIARVLGKADDAEHYAALAKNIQETFEKTFYDPEKECYRGEIRAITEYRQSADAVPLYFGMVPKEKQTTIVGNLVRSLAERKDHFNTGWIGTYALMEVLPECGMGENIYRVATQTNKFSWGWMLTQSTVCREIWGGLGPHVMWANISSYFYRWLAGIQPDAEHPGFRHFFIRPTFVKDLEFVRASYRCPSGLIESQWKRQDGHLTLVAVVPPNTTATITVPAADAGVVNESGCPAAQAQGVKFVRAGNGAAVFEVQSGSYRFEMPEREKSKTGGMRN